MTQREKEKLIQLGENVKAQLMKGCRVMALRNYAKLEWHLSRLKVDDDTRTT